MSETKENNANTSPPDAVSINELTENIATRLAEPNIPLLRIIIESVGLEQAQELLAELVLLSAAAAALSRAPLTKAERARRLRPILARREALEAALFPER